METLQREAIAPIRDRSPLNAQDRQIVADVLTWDCQRPVSPQEIETIAILEDMVWVKLTDNRAIPLHVDTFKSIRRQQLEQQETQAQENPSSDEIEVDSTGDRIYRVWVGMAIIGTFHQSPVDSKWLANPVYGHDYNRYHTSDEAMEAIVAAWKQAQVTRSQDQALQLLAA